MGSMRTFRIDASATLLSVGGMALAHLLAFALAEPDPVRRASELATTGHAGSEDAFLLAFVILLGAGLLGRTVGAWRRGAGGGSRSRLGAALAATQLSAFVTLECVERLAAGLDPLGLLEEPAFLLGLALQVIVAASVALLSRALVRLAVACTCRPLARSTGTRARWPRRRPATTTLSLAVTPWGVRGPPAALPS